MDVSALLRGAVAWAEGEPDVVGVALVGSHARGSARPDSDVDLVILARDPQPYLRDTRWPQRFGPVASCEPEDWGRVTSLRVLYEGGLEVEFGLTTPEWAELPVDAGTRRVVRDGMRVLHDPAGLLARLARAVDSP